MKWLYFVIIAFIAIHLQSCCTDMECGGIKDLNQISLVNFDATELDSVYLVEALTNDTLNISINTYSNDSVYRLSLNGSRLNPGFSYTLYINSLNTSYTINNFKTKKERCNTGFMCRDFFRLLTSYDVNGLSYPSANEVRVYK